MSSLVLALLSFCAAGIGALGGLGGAVLRVPALVVTGMEPAQAAPLGLLTVAASSLSASSTQLDGDTVNHRLGVTLAVSASAGAALGALLSAVISTTMLRWLLAGAAIGSGIATAARRGPVIRHRPGPMQSRVNAADGWPAPTPRSMASLPTRRTTCRPGSPQSGSPGSSPV